ncbi:serine/threonine protein kinase [Kribbella sp. NBC_00382]|uniref:serine/threonine protein kinase n=1 Tax=Kribbella sp. NBC_00382 TaxID=2975967 RepID=UPI002E208136
MAEIPVSGLVLRAEGPVASVFLVAPVAGGRTAVLKVYPQPLDRRTYNGVEVEQAKLAGLRSVASILRVDALEELPDGRTGLRMEFCPQSLVELVAGRPLPIGDVVVLGQILASVLADAHNAGLVHGGVTPANVLERSSGQPALSDFGMALRLRFPRDLMGDAAYTAPEVLRDGELSEQADVYGLGAVLYLALTGHSPFPARTGEAADDVVLRVLREPVPEVSGRDVPAALAGLLTRMMAKEPDARPEAAQVVQELEALLLQADEPAVDDLDFDDFRDELATGRVTQVAPARVPVKKTAKKKASWKKPSKTMVIAGAAAVALLAVVPVVLQPGDKKEPTAGPLPQMTPTVTATPQPVDIELKPPQDLGTSVKLQWSTFKPMTVAVFGAEQGKKEPVLLYKGTSTSWSGKITPGLKYCFEVQGTDGVGGYTSKPMPIRGASCSS